MSRSLVATAGGGGHHGWVDRIELARIVDDAVAASGCVGSGDEYWEILVKATGVGVVAADLAVGMLAADDPTMRATGCDVLGVACNGDDRPHRWAAAALVELAGRVSSREVLWSIAGALQHAADPIAIPMLVALASHEDSGIRFEVALALPAAMAGQVDNAGVEALIRLCGDPDAETRNWATFGLGRQVEVDGVDVRQALWARVGDEDEDVREEGICGNRLGGSTAPPPTLSSVARRATVAKMSREVSQRELRNESGKIMRELDEGETFIVTRNGIPVGELAPLRRHRFVPAETAVAVFKTAPPVDSDRFQADLDGIASQDATPRG